MIIIDIPEVNETLFLPSELSECDETQFGDMAKLIFLFNNGEINYQQFSDLAIYKLLNLKNSDKKPDPASEKWSNFVQLTKHIETFFEVEEKEGKKFIKLINYDITNKLPVYKLLRTYHGPKDGLLDITYGQYSDGLEEFICYAQTGDFKSLQLLFAIFYRKKNLFTRKLEKYNFEKAKKRAKRIFIHTDIRHLYGFFLLFDAFNKYTTSGTITVFGEEIDLSIIYNDADTKSAIPGIGVHGIVNDLAETGIFGDAEGVRQTNFWTVALQLYYMKKKQIDQFKGTTNEPT